MIAGIDNKMDMHKLLRIMREADMVDQAAMIDTGDMDNNEGDVVDTVTVDVPLLIRMLEYAREDAQTDMDLHNVTEKMIELAKHGALSMDQYDAIVGGQDNMGQEGPVTEETEFRKGDSVKNDRTGERGTVLHNGNRDEFIAKHGDDTGDIWDTVNEQQDVEEAGYGRPSRPRSTGRYIGGAITGDMGPGQSYEKSPFAGARHGSDDEPATRIPKEFKNVSITIDGNVWKVFAGFELRKAENIARSLKAKGKQVGMRFTNDPVTARKGMGEGGHNGKTEHSGAKKGVGAYRGRKKEAKNDSNKARRSNDKDAVKDEVKENYGCTSSISGETSDENVSFTQTKNNGDSSLTISANAKNIEELHAMLKLAGIDMPHTDQTDTEVAIEPEVTVVSPSASSLPSRYNGDKMAIIDKLHQSLKQKFNL